MQFTGRLTADAEVQTVNGDRKVTKFTVALNKRFKDRNGDKQEKTAFIRCAYWVNTGLAEYLTKGSVVEITGWVEAEAWLNKDDEPQAYLACNVDSIKLFGGNTNPAVEKGDGTSGKAKKGKEKAAVTAGAPDEDDLPF